MLLVLVRCISTNSAVCPRRGRVSQQLDKEGINDRSLVTWCFWFKYGLHCCTTCTCSRTVRALLHTTWYWHPVLTCCTNCNFVNAIMWKPRHVIISCPRYTLLIHQEILGPVSKSPHMYVLRNTDNSTYWYWAVSGEWALGAWMYNIGTIKQWTQWMYLAGYLQKWAVYNGELRP